MFEMMASTISPAVTKISCLSIEKEPVARVAEKIIKTPITDNAATEPKSNQSLRLSLLGTAISRTRLRSAVISPPLLQQLWLSAHCPSGTAGCVAPRELLFALLSRLLR